MNNDLLQRLLSDESVTRSLLAALPKKDTDGGTDSDPTALLCLLAGRLPPHEKELAGRFLLALLLVSPFARENGD